MSLGHDKISSFSDEEDSTISGPFPEEVEATQILTENIYQDIYLIHQKGRQGLLLPFKR
jgi:hypothetical protein